MHCASEKAGLSGFVLYNVEIQIVLFSLDRLLRVPDSVSTLAHGITQQREGHNSPMLNILSFSFPHHSMNLLLSSTIPGNIKEQKALALAQTALEGTVKSG